MAIEIRNFISGNERFQSQNRVILVISGYLFYGLSGRGRRRWTGLLRVTNTEKKGNRRRQRRQSAVAQFVDVRSVVEQYLHHPSVTVHLYTLFTVYRVAPIIWHDFSYAVNRYHILTDFRNCFSVRIGRKFAIMPSLKIPPHFSSVLLHYLVKCH